MMRAFIRASVITGRFLWSWTFLKIVFWAITLAIFIYVEEDWRGACAWAATKAKWEAKGESFDVNRFVPPPIPDDENLAAIPLFKQEPAAKGDLDLLPVALRKALRTSSFYLEGYDLPRAGNWQRGQPVDTEEFRHVITVDYALVFKGAPLPHDTLDQFDALYPFLDELRSAVTTRPLCRFDLDYTTEPPAGRPLGLLTDQLTVSKLLTIDAILALNEQRSNQALQDIEINCVLLSGAEHNPTLVGGLVAIGMNAVGKAAIFQGLALHAWSDVQLTELQRVLSSINFLSDYQFDVRSTAAVSVENLEYFKKYPALTNRQGLSVQTADSGDALFIRTIPHWPDGWWDQNKNKMATFLFRELDTVNPQLGLVFPTIDSDLSHQVDQATARWDAVAPWNIWFTISAPPLYNQTRKFANAQAWVDEARIVCALERYRLAQDVYPRSIDALAPAYIDSVPHDIMNGQPYHFRLRPNSTFLLYSVGWNQVDDGGTVIFKKDSPQAVDYERGDWVWPM